MHPTRRGYRCGEVIERLVYGLEGKEPVIRRFAITGRAGSGFAGQVYQACLEGAGPGQVGGQEQAGLVAIKVLRPRHPWKEGLRDLLFWLSYQVPFAPRFSEAAVRSGLIWQELFRRAAQIKFHNGAAVARPLGYYWEEDMSSFAEVHEWVSGREMSYSADERLLDRLLGWAVPPADSEVSRKQKFMRALVDLCHEIGAPGLARQYEWYTFVSQANVLTRTAPASGGSEFVAVDCRPGLAVPFFLPLSPVHACIILRGLPRGVFAHYYEVDLAQLDAYLAAHPQEFGELAGLAERLKMDEQQYRAGLPDLWHKRARLVTDRAGRRALRDGLIAAWERAGLISTAQAGELRLCSRKFALFLLLANLPFAGRWLMPLLGDETYRRHLARFLFDPAYRRLAWGALKANDLLDWQDGGRLAPAHLAALAASIPRYLLEKLALSWQPSSCHRFATDQEYRREVFHALFVRPVRLCFDRAYREKWLAEIIARQQCRGLVDQEQAARLQLQAKEDRMAGYLRDLGVTAGLEGLAKAVYIILVTYGISSGNLWPLIIALLGPISPSGVARVLYILAQLVRDLPDIVKYKDTRLLASRLLGLLVAPWRFVGNLFAPLEMFAYYSQASLLLGEYYASRIVAKVPVFGGKGKLMEYWVFALIYNLPLSMRRIILNG